MTTATMEAQVRELDDRIVRESLAEARWTAMELECPHRLDQLCADAVERAPAVTAWASGRLALLRLRTR